MSRTTLRSNTPPLLSKRKPSASSAPTITIGRSIEHTVETKAAHVGSNNDKAVWQELGTTTIPARSFLAGAAAHKFNEVGHEIGRVVHGYLSNGGVVVQDRIGLTGSH
jgi:hypothetical protein